MNANANIMVIPATKSRLEMTDIFQGFSYALQLKGGLLNIILGLLGSFSLNLLTTDFNMLMTAIPAFLGALSAVGVGAWYSVQKKKVELDEMNIEIMNKLIKNGTIKPDMDIDERMAILKKFKEA